VTLHLKTWLNCVLALIVSKLLLHRGRETSSKSELDTSLSKLVEKIQALQGVPKDELPVAIEQLVQTAEILGFDIAKTPKTFRWREEDKEKYESYGHIEPEDEVIVKRMPVIFKGKVKQKGLVLKVRKGGER
jgi:hypothetical protein